MHGIRRPSQLFRQAVASRSMPVLQQHTTVLNMSIVKKKAKAKARYAASHLWSQQAQSDAWMTDQQQHAEDESMAAQTPALVFGEAPLQDSGVSNTLAVFYNGRCSDSDRPKR